jgi:uncharacterized protein (TIGR03435 family)
MAELTLVVKVTVVLAFALLAVRAAHRLSAAMRSLMLVCTFGLLLLLPAASMLLPAQPIEVPAHYSAPLASVGLTVMPLSTEPVSVNGSPADSSRFTMPSVRSTVRAAWIAGAIGFAVPLVMGLFQLRRLNRHGRSWTPHTRLSSIDVRVNDELRVPITYGALRPVIALPGDAPGWTDAELRRVLLHELEHVRRRDWPVHLIARGICALYWFHPLAWIAWRRLCLESERACDDAVLREEDGGAYASQLVALARRISNQDAVPMLSIAGRSHLSTRVTAMLAGNLARGPVRRAAAIAVSSVAIVAAFGIGPLKAVTSIERSTLQPPSPALTFGSTTIQRTSPPTSSTAPCCQVRYASDGTMSAANVGLVNLIASAYSIYLWQVDKAPAWAGPDAGIGGERFDIAATARTANADDRRSMLKAMLADRFHLAVHTERRTQKVYELVVEPTGHRLLPAGPHEDRESDDVWLRVNPDGMIATLDVDRWTTAQLARHIAFPLQTLVLDHTGLTGVYHVKATWSAASSLPGTAATGAPCCSTIFDAFPAQLGLRLRETTGSVEYLVVDRAERPRLDTR